MRSKREEQQARIALVLYKSVKPRTKDYYRKLVGWANPTLTRYLRVMIEQGLLERVGRATYQATEAGKKWTGNPPVRLNMF